MLLLWCKSSAGPRRHTAHRPSRASSCLSSAAAARSERGARVSTPSATSAMAASYASSSLAAAAADPPASQRCTCHGMGEVGRASHAVQHALHLACGQDTLAF